MEKEGKLLKQYLASQLAVAAIYDLVRFGFLSNLPKYAEILLRFSNVFDYFGSADGGMHV